MVAENLKKSKNVKSSARKWGGGDKKAMKTPKEFFFPQINVFFHLMK